MKISISLGGTDDTDHAEELGRTGFWGKRGAGLLFCARDTGRLLVSHRSPHVQEPQTWGTWGGACDGKEPSAKAAEREAREETLYSGPLELEHVWTFTHGSGFVYDNFLAFIPSEFTPTLGWETQGFRWVSGDLNDWPKPLHPGLEALIKAAGPRLGILTKH